MTRPKLDILEWKFSLNMRGGLTSSDWSGFTKKCSDFVSAGKILKLSISSSDVKLLPSFTAANEKNDLGSAGPLNINWANQKHILLSIDKFSKFPSAEITSSPSTKPIIQFLQNYNLLHGFSKKCRVGPATYFISRELKTFGDTNKTNIHSCTIKDYRSNRLVKKLIIVVETTLNYLRIS